MSLGWNEANGAAVSSEVNYTKLKNGDTQFRIVSGVLARMDYWVHNTEGKPRPFECLRFDRNLERFVAGADPVQELGLKEKDPENPGKMRPLRCRRAYKCMVINRETGKLEAMDLKKSIFDGIIDTMKELGVQDPTTVEFIVKRTGEKWHEVKYSINAIATMKVNSKTAEIEALHTNDQDILDNMKPIDELFPRATPEKQRKELEAWLSAAKEGSAASTSDMDQEAVDDLD